MVTYRRNGYVVGVAIFAWLVGGLAVIDIASAAPPVNKRPSPNAATLHLADGGNQFAFDLYRELREREGNVFLAPASISAALSMTYAGAAGETAEQMKSVLHLDLPPEQLFPTLSLLTSELTASRQKGVEINVANRLWGQKSFDFRADYLQLTRDTFGAELVQLNFARNPNAARKAINDWVAKQTNDKISELMAPDSIKKTTRLVLTNAIYFNGEWRSPFATANTKPAKFALDSGKHVETQLMVQQQKLRYHQAKGMQLLEMPYRGDQLTMVAILPEKPGGLAAIEKSLSNESLQKMLTNVRQQDVVVWLPKFKIDSEFSLSGSLQALGMRLAFDLTKADFSGMCDVNGLAITDVIHKAVVDVNEQGTEATAATAVHVALGSMSGREPEKPVTFRADHPFIFLIREQATGSIVFMGRVSDPTK